MISLFSLLVIKLLAIIIPLRGAGAHDAAAAGCRLIAGPAAGLRRPKAAPRE